MTPCLLTPGKETIDPILFCLVTDWTLTPLKLVLSIMQNC